MKERGPWRTWNTLLLIVVGSLCSSIVKSQSYEGARGDSGDANPASLGFSGIETRHDGYVKGETPTIPQTSFSCSAQPYNPGLYADVETQCQVYHVCFEDRQESFLCGPGTNFNQRILACDFWYNFECQDAPKFYAVNADIGKVPDTVLSQGQGRRPGTPQQPQRPSYPSFPQQPAQPPSGGSYPPQVSVPPPPSRPEPQPQPPRFTPPPPSFVQPPAFRPEPPRVQPQPPRVYPDPAPAPRPQPPRVYPDPAPAPRPQPPVFRPQPRPDPPRVSVQPSYPRVPSGSGQGSKVRPPPSQQIPQTQQEEDGYQFEGYQPQRPVALPPPPPPPRRQTPRPVVFPPVVSPPRVSRPPLTPPIIRQPEISRPRVPTIDTRSEFHPDSQLKGNVGYQPPQQPRIPQPSRPVSSGYPSYPVAQRPVPHTPVAQRPVPHTPVAQRPVEKPSRPAYQPPSAVQQEHVDTEYVPPPPPPPREPSRPSTSYVPPPPPPVQQEVHNVGFTRPPAPPSRPAYKPPPAPPSRPAYRPPPPPPSRPAYRPPPVAQRPVDRPQPPVAPSIIREQQKPVAVPPSRPQVSVGVSRQPQPPPRPKPVFPPASDHPNSNIKGGPGYNQPPPQIPRFEPTRISRPSSPQGGYQAPPQAPRPRPVSVTAVKPASGKPASASAQGGYKTTQERVKKPSDPPRTVYQPPIQVIDHPQAEIKGVNYDPPRQPPQRVISPSTPVSGVKLPQVSVNQKPQTQRPRAPIVVARPQPPSLPTTTVKKTSPVVSQEYEKPRPQPPAPSRVKQPSTSHVQAVSRPSQPRFPSYEDHPNANVKGGSGYTQVQLQPVISRPSGPPSAPSVSYEQKTTSSNQGRGTGSGYPSRGDVGSIQQVIQREDYKPSRSSPPSSVKTVQKVIVKTAVKDTSSYQRPPSVSEHSVLINKQAKPDYEAGASYTRGPETYPKPEFGRPHTPVSTPSRVSQSVKTGSPSRVSQSVKTGSPSQNTITRSEIKPTYTGGSGASVSVGSGSGSDVRPDYPLAGIPGHQPPHQPQVFPHRENPDHPNESIKGSGAYRPPPPAGFQAAASEVQEQKVVVPEPEPQASLHGDTGTE